MVPGRWLARAIAVLAVLGGLSPAPSVLAQFNGNFDIERHRLDTENFLDWRAYRMPPSWRQAVYRRPNWMQATVGSLSTRYFYQFHELRLEKDLGRYATLLYHQQEDAFFRSEPIYQEIEMRAGAEDVFASVIGFPQHDKSLAALGAALAWGKRTDAGYLRYSRLEQYAYYNEKHEGSERFSVNPVLDRLEGRLTWNDTLFLQMDLRLEQPTQFVAPEAALTRTYQGGKADLVADWTVTDGVIVGLWGSDNREQRRALPDLPSAATPRREQTLAWGWWEAYGSWRFARGDALTLAYLVSRFSNDIRTSDGAADYRFRLDTGQAYGLWEVPQGPWFRWLFSFQAGRVLLTEDPPRTGSTPADADSVQVKGGAGFALVDEAHYRFWFNSTWDVDAISGQKWDGGNVQLQMYF
jgi:hypothetical protein